MKKALPLFLLAAAALFAFGCNSVKVQPSTCGTPGEITIYQGAWKSAVGKSNQVEATTDAAADTAVGLK